MKSESTELKLAVDVMLILLTLLLGELLAKAKGKGVIGRLGACPRCAIMDGVTLRLSWLSSDGGLSWGLIAKTSVCEPGCEGVLSSSWLELALECIEVRRLEHSSKMAWLR